MAPSTKSRKTGSDERDLIDRRRVGRVEIAREPSNGVSLRPGTIPLGDQGRQFEPHRPAHESNANARSREEVPLGYSTAVYIRHIRIGSFRHLKDIELGPFAEPPTASASIALAGPNGGGKSSILELLGYALSNTWGMNWQLSRNFPDSSFEIALGLTAEERRLCREWALDHNPQLFTETLAFLEHSDVYYRSFGFSGRYAENSGLNDAVHNLVSAVLRDHYERGLGFFLKSDRFYPTRRFENARIFEYPSIRTRRYARETAFGLSDQQYQRMYDYLAQQRFHYARQLGSFYLRQEKGGPSEPRPEDPLIPYNTLLGSLFPGYSFDEPEEEFPTDLYVKIPSGELLAFSDLSSGEKEVFFVLSFLIRNDIRNAVVVVDEPELHLHPELARILVRTMLSLRPSNQVWLATHSSEVIDEVGRDSLYYVTRDPATRRAAVTPATDEDASITALKTFFGFSGYVGVGRALVFLEGTNSGADRKTLGQLFPDESAQCKFVPAQSGDSMERINAAILAILGSHLAWINYYLIRDRDYLTDDEIQGYEARAGGRIHVLRRHEIENYLINDRAIADVHAAMKSESVNLEQVAETLRSVARALSTDHLRDMVVYRLNRLVRPEDFSIGRYMTDQPVVADDGSWDEDRYNQLRNELVAAASRVANEVQSKSDTPAVEAIIDESRAKVESALNSEDWRSSFPGKQLLRGYARRHELGKEPAFENALIRALSDDPDRVPDELRSVMRDIAAGSALQS